MSSTLRADRHPLTISPRGVAVFSGLVLAAVGVYGLTIDGPGMPLQDFLVATWLPPIVLWPVTTMICALDPGVRHDLRGQAAQLWPMYAGLALFAVLAGHWWDYGASIGALEDYAATLKTAVMTLHLVVFVGGGLLLMLHPKSRPAAFQLWLGYALLIGCWELGTLIAS